MTARLCCSRALSRLRRHEDAQSSVEIAVSMPVLLLLLTGIFSYGLALKNYVTLEEAVGAGGRTLALSRSQGGDPCAQAASTVAMDAPTLNNSGSTVSGLGFTIGVDNQTYASATPQCPNAVFNQAKPVSLTVTYPCTLSLFRVGSLSNCYISAMTTEVIQ